MSLKNMSNPKDVPKLPPIELRDLASMELRRRQLRRELLSVESQYRQLEAVRLLNHPPRFVGVIFRHLLSEVGSFLTQIFLIDLAIFVDEESHDAA